MRVLQSNHNNQILLEINEGIADLQINGERYHLGVPYLHAEYVPSGSCDDRVFAGYRIEGLVFGFVERKLTTPILIATLRFLGFSFTAETFRKEIQGGSLNWSFLYILLQFWLFVHRLVRSLLSLVLNHLF